MDEPTLASTPMRVGASAGSYDVEDIAKRLVCHQVLCASDWNISACGSCGLKNKKKLFVKPPSPSGPGHRPYPHPLKLVSTYLQQPG